MPANEAVAHSARADLALITQAAREAGLIAMGFFRRDPEVWWKEGTSPVSKADLEVDRYLRDHLLSARPSYGWLSEETVDDLARLRARRTFVVDPIDGTRAFIDGRKTWCISIAVVEDGRAIAGVLECPATGEVYCAVEGEGVWRNDEPISIAAPQHQLSLAGPKSMIKALPEEVLARVVPHPYVPSLAYRIAMVARGALHATFVKPFSHDWDLAAANVILREAGGSIIDGNGQAPVYAGPNTRLGPLAAGSGDLLDIMGRVVKEIVV